MKLPSVALLLLLQLPVQANPIHEAARKGDTAEVTRILNQHPDQLNAPDAKHANTPLHWACYEGRTELVKLLLRKGAKVNALTQEGYTPLRDACYRGKLEAAKLLLSKGANPTLRDHAQGGTPLHWAAQGNRDNVVDLLIDCGVSPAASDAKGYLAEDWARDAGHKRLSLILNMRLQTHVTILMDKGKVDELRELLTRKPALARLRLYRDDQETILHIAPTVAMARLLLDYGADLEARANPTGDGAVGSVTPLHYQSLGGHTEVVKFLLSRGAKVNARAGRNVTALQQAALRCQTSTLQALLDGGADVNAVDDYGFTALHEVATRSDILVRRGVTNEMMVDAAAVLIKAGAHVQIRNKAGHTAEEEARENKHPELAKFLHLAGG